MTGSAVFTINRRQAVPLPKAGASPAEVREVEIIKLGESRLISPAGQHWDDLFLDGPRATDDFLSGREQPPAEQSDPL